MRGGGASVPRCARGGWRRRLALHERKCVIRRTSEGLPFLGYVVWPDHIRVRGETVRRSRRRTRLRQCGTTASAAEDWHASLEAWRGHVSFAGSYRSLASLR